MAEHKVQAVFKNNTIHPDCPAPTPQQEEPCEGELQGSITGKVYLKCCCPRLYTATAILEIGPQTVAQLRAILQNTASAWETNNYLLLGSHITDTGGGWIVGLHIGWYQ